MKLIQLKQKEIGDFKHTHHARQGGVCPVLKKFFCTEYMVLDHQHKLKTEQADSTGKGICRGVIQFQANAFEGKVTNAYKRLGLNKFISLPDVLRNLADYLEHNMIHEQPQYIHPSEKPRRPVLLKRSYNKLVKAVNGKQKIPAYKEKRGNYIKPLQKLYAKYGLEPKFKSE